MTSTKQKPDDEEPPTPPPPPDPPPVRYQQVPDRKGIEVKNTRASVLAVLASIARRQGRAL